MARRSPHPIALSSEEGRRRVPTRREPDMTQSSPNPLMPFHIGRAGVPTRRGRDESQSLPKSPRETKNAQNNPRFFANSKPTGTPGGWGQPPSLKSHPTPPTKAGSISVSLSRFVVNASSTRSVHPPRASLRLYPRDHHGPDSLERKPTFLHSAFGHASVYPSNPATTQHHPLERRRLG